VGAPLNANFKQNVCKFLQADSTSDTLNYNATVTLRQPAFLSPRHTASFAVFAERRSEFKAYTRQAVGANVAVTFNARRDVPVTVGTVIRWGGRPQTRWCTARGSSCATGRSGVPGEPPAVRGDHDLRRTRSRELGARSLGERDAGDHRLCVAIRALGYLVRVQPRRARTLEVLIPVASERARLADPGGTILPQRISLLGQSTPFVPPDQRFYAGGPNSVRGYTRNGWAPACIGPIPSR